MAHFVLSDFLNLSLQQSDESASPLLGLNMAPADSMMLGNPACPAPKPNGRAAHKRPSLKRPDAGPSAAAISKTLHFAPAPEPAAAAGSIGKAKPASEAVAISPFSNWTGGADEKEVEQARIKALSRSFDKRQHHRKSALEVVEEADKEGDSGEEGSVLPRIAKCIICDQFQDDVTPWLFATCCLHYCRTMQHHLEQGMHLRVAC